MSTNQDEFLDWIVYQIYPRSFYDDNGDGIGDLQGVTAKLDYLLELGINAIWLCPCYKSPNVDNGYDVSDYRDIMDEFGTLDDWKQLRAETKKRNIKLIMDLVFNHTSSKHIWFENAKLSRDNPYHDYYIWAKKPLNDWKSVFGGSAWEYNEATDEYYLHSFAVEQPDLNWKNPKVRQECRDIVDFWVDMGVDGFRCDVLDFIAKDFKNGRMYNGPKLHEYIRGLFGRQKTARIFTVGECQSKKKDICDICGSDRKELTTVFQFDHILLGRKYKYAPKPLAFDKLRKILVKWQNFSQKNNILYTLFTDNHDNPYFLSRAKQAATLRYEIATTLAATFFLLRGIPFLYQTQEYGAINPYYDDVNAFSEVETLQYYQARKKKMTRAKLIEKINLGSRDNTRRPFAWTNSDKNYHGFSKAKPWIIPHSFADEINLEKDRKSNKSVFAFYQKLLALRKDKEVLRHGEFTDLTGDRKDCFIFKRSLGKSEIIVVCNYEQSKRLLPDFIREETHKVLLSNGKNEPFAVVFQPFETVVYERI